MSEEALYESMSGLCVRMFKIGGTHTIHNISISSGWTLWPLVCTITLRVSPISVFRVSFPAPSHNLWLIHVLSQRPGVTRQNTTT